MKEHWKEAEEHKVTLSEAEPDVFALCLELLYVSCHVRKKRLTLMVGLQTDLLHTKEPTRPSDE
jgi:hypothetical protein